MHDKVASLVDAGRSLDEIEASVLATSPLGEEERAALWLYAWSRKRRNEERGAPVHPSALARAGQPGLLSGPSSTVSYPA
jgi:hypothetical protein